MRGASATTPGPAKDPASQLGPGMAAMLKQSEQSSSLVELLQRRLLEATNSLEDVKAENARLKLNLMTGSNGRSTGTTRTSLDAISSLVSGEDPRVAELKTTVEVLRSDVEQLTEENKQLQRVREDAAIVSALRVQLEAARAENEGLKAKIRQELLLPPRVKERPAAGPSDEKRDEIEREIERAMREHFQTSDENMALIKERFLKGLEDLRARIESEVRQQNGDALRENRALRASQKAHRERLGVLEVEMEALRNQVKRMRGLMDLAEAERRRSDESRQKAEAETAKAREAKVDATKQLTTAVRDRDAARHELQSLKMTLDALAAERDSLEAQLQEERDRNARRDASLDADDLPAILRGAKLSSRARDVAVKAKDVDGLTELLQAASEELQRARDEAAMERAAAETLQRAAAEMRGQSPPQSPPRPAPPHPSPRPKVLDECARWRAAAERLQSSILRPSPRRSIAGRFETPAAPAPPVSLPASAAAATATAAVATHSALSSPGNTPTKQPRKTPASQRALASSSGRPVRPSLRPASAPSSAPRSHSADGKGILRKPGGSYHMRLRDVTDPVPARTAAEIDAKVEDMLASFADAGVHFELQRVGDGQYKYGARLLKLSVINGKLMVRVGGGYCSLYEGLLASGAGFLGGSSPPRA
eukprot:tig00020830_g14436.t1